MSEWQSEPLGKVTTKVQTGSTPSTSRPEFFNGEIAWFTPADIGQNRLLEQSLRNISKLGLREGKARLFEPGTLLVTCIGNIGRVGVLAQPASSNQQITALKFSHKIDPNFAYYWFVKNQSELENKASQAVVPILNSTRLKEIPFSYPPLAEQQRIAGILARGDRLRQLRRYALEVSEGYLQSVFLELFGDPVTNPMGWPLMKLGNLGKLDRGRSRNRPRNAPELLGGSYPLIQTGDIANASGYIRKYTQTYSEIGLAQSKMWPKGTLCITIAANIAKTAILTFEACFPDSVVGFTPNDRTNVEFIQHWFSFIQKILEAKAPESAQKNINLEILRNLEVPLPPFDIQKQFTSVVGNYERLRAQQHEAARQADHLFASLLHRAFRGELPIPSPSPNPSHREGSLAVGVPASPPQGEIREGVLASPPVGETGVGEKRA